MQLPALPGRRRAAKKGKKKEKRTERRVFSQMIWSTLLEGGSSISEGVNCSIECNEMEPSLMLLMLLMLLLKLTCEFEIATNTRIAIGI